MSNRSKQKPIGMWETVRDVLMASMKTGQFPLALGGLIFIIIVIRMPSADVSKLMFDILSKVEPGGSLFGIPLSGGCLTGWFIHVRWQRKKFAGELERMAKVRNQVQEAKLGEKLIESSDT